MSFFKKVGDALTHGVKDVKDGIKDFESKPRSSPKMDKSSGRSSTKTSIKLPSAKPFVSRKGDEETQKQLKQFAANSLRADSVAMRKTFSAGWVGTASVIAFDPVQCLVAVGTTKGIVHMYGQPGLEMKINIPERQCVKFMHFVINEGYLIVITDANQLYYIDYHSGGLKITVTHSIGTEVSASEMASMSEKDTAFWLYLGTTKGNVITLTGNAQGVCQAKDQIYWNHFTAPSNKSHPGKIVAIKESPTLPTRLLIAHSEGNVCVYCIKKKVTTMLTVYKHKTIRSLSWHPLDNRFLVGFEDGTRLSWANNKLEPQHQSESNHTLNAGSSEQQYQPVERMEWTNSDHQLILVYQGGSPQNKTYSNITIVRKGDKRNSMAFEKKVVGFCLCKDSPWAQDAAAVPCLLLCFPNELVALELQSPIQVLQAPYCTQLARSVVTTYQVCWDIDKTLMNTLRLLGKKQCIDTISKSWPIRGGQRAPKPSHASLDIAVVGHNNGIVKIYDISSALSVTLVCVVSVVVLCGHANLPPPADCGIKSVELQPKNRHMVLVCNSGEVLLLSFALSAATVSVKVASAVLDEPCETTIEKVIALSKPAAKLEVPGSPSASKKSEGSVLDADTEVEAPAPAPVEVDLEAPVVDFKNRFKKVSQVTAPPPEVEISGTDSDESMSDSERADTGDSTQPETDTPTDAAPEASAATVKATPSAATDTRSYEVEAYMPPGFQLALYFKGILNSPEDATPLTDGIIATHSSAYAALAVANGLGAVCVVDTAEGEVLMCEHLLQSAQLLGEAHPQSEKPPAKIQRLASDTITSLSFNAMFPSPSSDAEAKVDLTTPTPTLFITTAMSGVALAMVVPHTFCMLTSFDYSKTAQTWKDTNVIAKGLNNIVAAAKSLETSSRSLDKPACDSKPVVDTEPINTPTSGDTIILLTPDGRPIKSPQCQWDEDEDADVDISASVQLIDIAPNAASDTDPFVFGVAVSGSSVSLLSLPANVILSTFDTPNSMAIASATVINWSVPFTSPSGETVGNVLHCGLVLLDDVGNLSLLSLPDLKPIVPAAQTTLKGLTGIPSVSPDGRLVAISHTGSVEHWSIIRAENRLGLPASLGCFFTPGILLPPRETAGGGFLSSVFGGNDASVDRASLFTMSDGSDAMQRIAGAREHRDTAKQKMMDTKQQSETIGDTMRENKQMLQERGEKLESIGDKTEDMKNDAQNFLGNIREYNRKQAAKKWYQI